MGPHRKPTAMLTRKDDNNKKTIIDCQGQLIGGEKIIVMSGSCSVESESQIMETAQLVSAAGATILRGGAFKPRTSPYDFQGLGEVGLEYLSKAAKQYGMLSISEIMDASDIEMTTDKIDILQVGTRNMQNYSLLKQLGRVKNPILLKRGFAATYREFLLAAEYIMNAGNPNIILCERGIRTFETYTRNTLDIAAVPILQELSHLPVVIDPSHGVGLRQYVEPMAYAAIAAGCDGLLIEAHPTPDKALSDAQQTISPDLLAEIVRKGRAVAKAVGRTL
ncbi:MAG: 3-deoxy-7-phosphoheptulonate synthase [Gammaproteobacteria bacterium CG11_big_fil_rev_8_21_14_0_20_46_22]|nr:MAG: 3-deoxy-7-phosphoheptulonate synthase [Gammaproteobacteria bacterium CG12_big_fil_rev_8_21_14_0_65_46_12]PIR10726.1 MAG: 3-deoxy-7-phosphoheptulonate synthase [Gammaproteobacteria bacterium CG11_big_fil_rev_8_21_14_0_20_46_22]